MQRWLGDVLPHPLRRRDRGGLSAYVLVAAYVLHRTADTPADAAAVHLLVVAGGGLLLPGWAAS